MKRLLVIAYYFPPMGLSGVQRISKFVKYLPENGWQPTVLTVEPGGYFAFDQSLMAELDQADVSIVRTASWDPTKLFKQKSTVSLPVESSRRWLSGLSQFVFIPDNKIGWYKPAVEKATTLHNQEPFDAILATAPPYTCCLIARKLSRRFNIPYVLDFRDDWLGNPRHVYPTRLHKKLHKQLEKRALASSSAVVTINKVIATSMKRRHPELKQEIRVIEQGFDPEDFTSQQHSRPEKLRFLYTGVFYDVQKPDFFLKALSSFLINHPSARNELEADFIGLIPGHTKSLINDLNLQDVVTHQPYQPHSVIVEELQKADVLWLTIGSGPGQESISTGKLFEYMGTMKPILGLVPDGTAKQTLNDYAPSFIAAPEQISDIREQIRLIYEAWKEGRLPRAKEENVSRYDRKNLTTQLARQLNAVLT